ncbi:MAG: DUF3857 domain-containing protein [Planctomycetes bacterium]|nr:DUF3857 domain-containing protein [Planctomycetota bacterium]
MRKLTVSLIFAALLAALLSYQPAPAQDAPEGLDPYYLRVQQLELWEAWIHGDLKATYTKAQEILESDAGFGDEFVTTLALQAEAADELGWHDAHVRDLQTLIEMHADEEEVAHLRWELIQRLKHAGKTDEIGEQTQALGMLTNWMVCGPFVNDRGQGFEDVQEPEDNLSLDAEYTGRDGQTVAFRPLPAKLLGGTVNIGAMLRPNTEATAFLITAIYAEGDIGDTRLCIGSTGDVKAWLVGRIDVDQDGNPVEAGSPLGVPLLEQRDERALGIDQTVESIKLQRGWNVLVVKVGNGGSAWQFCARVEAGGGWREAANSGELAEALGSVKAYKVAPADGLGGDTVPPNAEEQFFASARELLRPRKDRTTTIPRRQMGDALEEVRADWDKADGAERALLGRQLAVYGYVAAWANRSVSRVLAGKEENRRRELLKQCLELDPKAARAALELSQYYTTTFGNPALADEYAQTAVKANPDWVEARVYASRVVLMKGLDIEVERELAKLLQEYPEDANVLRFSAYYAGLRRDYKLSNDLFAKALKSDFADGYSRDRLLERAVARADMPTALKLAGDARKLDPFDTDAAKQLADLYLYSEKYSLAERELAKALQIAPRDDVLLERLGRVYSGWADISAGDKADELRTKAQDAYVAALEANPKREDIERYLEFLEGEQPPFEAALQEDITERIQAVLELPVDSDNPYEIVYNDEIVVVNEDGTTSQYLHTAYRITNDNGREWLQSLQVPAYSDQQGRCVAARVWHADGEFEEGKRSRFGASFPPLEVGDIVEVRFRVTDGSQSFFGDFYGTRKSMADYVPVHEVRYAWVLPPGREFHEYLTNGAPARIEQAVEGRRVWSYRTTDLHKVYDEPLAPPLEQRSPTVQISTYANWKEFGRWYYNLIRKQMEPTPEMTAKVVELTKGLTTEKDKARAVYNWVVTEVRYNADWHFGVHGYKPFSAGAVFARCIGDCKDKALLICTMLRIAGVTAYPVITNLENFRGDEDITLPMPAHFNHAIAHVEYSDGTSQFVDGTATYNGIDELGSGDRGANCIIVRPEGGERVQIPWGTAEDDSQTDEIDAEFAAGGTLKLSVTRTAVGDSSSILRAQFEREGDRKKRLELEWSEHYPGAKVGNIVVNDLSDLDVQPKLTFTVELPNAYATKDGRIEFRTALDPREWTQTSFGSLTTRKTDLLTPAPYERISIVHYKLPAGRKVANLPAALEIQHPNVSLGVSAESKNGVLTVTRKFALLGGTVKAADYPGFRSKLIQFDTAELATIKLSK